MLRNERIVHFNYHSPHRHGWRFTVDSYSLTLLEKCSRLHFIPPLPLQFFNPRSFIFIPSIHTITGVHSDFLLRWHFEAQDGNGEKIILAQSFPRLLMNIVKINTLHEYNKDEHFGVKLNAPLVLLKLCLKVASGKFCWK